MNEKPLEVGEACRAVLRDIAPLGKEEVRLADALGRVLAQDVRSPLELPPWDNASMDGYAVRADDVAGATRDRPRSLRVLETVSAGMLAKRSVGPGEAVRIMTGAPVPKGADTVIRVEDTDAGESSVEIRDDRDARRNVRPKGEDLRNGDVAVGKGEVLGPAHLGVLASVGRASVGVYRRARVGVLATGDELVDVDRFDEVLAGKRIVSSNTYTLLASAREAGAEPVSLGVVRDDPKALRERLESCDCDLILTSGGVSAGAFDFTRPVLNELGLEPRFWRVRIRPGGPVGFGYLRGIPWLGLPGNPVSSLVTFELFGRPAIRRMHGLAQPFRRVETVTLAEPVSIGAPLVHFLRAVITDGPGGPTARLTGPQGSGLLTSMARANALLIVPPERATLRAGEQVTAMRLGDSSAHAESPPA